MNYESNDEIRIFKDITEYCKTCNISRENLPDILKDQEVLPVILGDANKYMGAEVLRRMLDGSYWSVGKINPDSKPDTHGKDLIITERRTGMRIKVEIKNAVRGSFKLEARGINSPHFAVRRYKSERDPSKTYNDKHEFGEFDLLLCNSFYSIFRRSPDSELELIDDEDALYWLKMFHNASTDGELMSNTYEDWHVCMPGRVAFVGEALPPAPKLLMTDDPNWFSLYELDENLRGEIHGYY